MFRTFYITSIRNGIHIVNSKYIRNILFLSKYRSNQMFYKKDRCSIKNRVGVLWKNDIKNFAKFTGVYHTLPCKKNYLCLRIPFPFSITLLILFHFRGRRCLILITGVLSTWEILNEIILLRTVYDVASTLEKIGTDRSKWFHCKTSRFFVFLVQTFKEITQNLFQICFTLWKNS